MPQVILAPVAFAAFQAGAGIGVANAILGVGTVGAIVHAGVSTALVLGASYAVAKLTAPAMPRAVNGSIERKDPLAARFWSYGRCKVSGPILLLEVNFVDDNRRLLKITALGSRELAMMDPFFVDGNKVTLAAGIGGSDGSYANWASNDNNRGLLRTHLGRDDQTVDTQLLHDFPIGWTTAHRLQGIPYVYGQFESAHPEDFQEAFPTGEPTVAAVGGVKLYDPRKDSTNGGSGSHRMNDPMSWEFSENQRLACLDWLMWKDGYAKSWARVDWASWVQQIAMADENIPLKAGGTEPRYRIATIVGMDEPKGRVLRRIMDAGDQQLYTTREGLIGSRGGVWHDPTVSLGPSEIVEGQFTHGISMMDRTNEFELSAVLASHDYSEVDLEPWSNRSDPEFVAGIVKRQSLDLQQVPSNSQAQRLAKIRMAKANPQWAGSIRTNFAGLDAIGEAAINLSFNELDVPAGSFNGPFLVNGKIGFLPDKTGMTVSVSSIDPACYDWNAATEEQDAPPVPEDA